MKLFKKNKFVWAEPWFFCQRVRDRSDWLRAVLLAILASVGMTTVLFLLPAVKFSSWQIVLVGLMVGAAVQLALEAPFMRRDISIDDDSIVAFGNAGQFTSHISYPINQITAVDLRRAEEVGKPYSMLVLRMNTQGGIIGIPSTIRLEQLARVLHQMNVPVTLSGWEPVSDSSSSQNEYVYMAPEGAAFVNASNQPIPEIDQNLTPLPQMIVALFMAMWLLLIWLVLLVFAGIYLYQSRQTLSIWIIACAAIALFASLTIPFKYLEIFGECWSANYLIGVGKSRVQCRGDSLIKTSDDRIRAVELIQRETWAAMAPKVVDFGFMLVEPEKKRIVFEGNKERWVVPFGSVKLCKVEEVQYGTAGESISGQLRCFVVLEVQRSSGPFETGLRVAEKELGKATDTRRMRQAVELFENLTGGLHQTHRLKPETHGQAQNA